MIRITGGLFKGRNLVAPTSSQSAVLRPTQSRLRQALFNSLQGFFSEAEQVLDLFAGTGMMGFEALSRGAKRVVFVEKSRSALKLIYENARRLGVGDRVVLIPFAVESAASRICAQGVSDWVFADPPYYQAWETRLLEELPWASILSPDGILTIEWAKAPRKAFTGLPDQVPLPEQCNLVKTREKNYGDTVLTTFCIQRPETEIRMEN